MRPSRTLTWILALATILVAPVPAQEGIKNLVDPDTVALLLETPEKERFVPGEMIVKLKAGTAREDAMPSLAGALGDVGMQPQEALTSGGEIIFQIPPTIAGAMSRANLESQTMAAVAAMQADPNVEYAQPNFILGIARTPNDPGYPIQWHYFNNGSGAGLSPGGIGLPDAWDTTIGSRSVVVAVIDTGILPAHADIAGSGNLVAGYDMISNTFIANDGDGRDPDPTDPGDAVAAGECGPGSGPSPSSWHGTHVAGTVGVGATDNAAGIAGVNWEVSVQAVRVLGKCGGTTADINDAIRWAAGLAVPGVPANATPAKVINMSLGGGGSCASSPSQQAAINDAVAAGSTVVVAAGNSASDAANFRPASCNGVITVAASDFRGHLSSRYSNFGATIEILAPGGDVQRDDNGDGRPDGVLSMVQGGYAFYNGTSMAAPHVAGAAALLLANDASLTPAQILSNIQSTALPRTAAQCPQPCGAGLLQVSFPPPVTVAIALSPSEIDLWNNQSETLTATVTSGGSPLPGVTVNFASADTSIVTVSPATAVTNASGQAQTTVSSGANDGDTTVTATVATASASVPASVPTATFWGVLIAMAVALLLMRKRLAGLAR